MAYGPLTVLGGGVGYRYKLDDGEFQDDPEFIAEPDGSPFVANKEYRVYAEHPELEPDGELWRVKFNEAGQVIDLDSTRDDDDNNGNGNGPSFPIVVTNPQNGDEGELYYNSTTNRYELRNKPKSTLDTLSKAQTEVNTEYPYDLTTVGGLPIWVDTKDAGGTFTGRVLRYWGLSRIADAITTAFSAANILSLKQRINVLLDDLLREQTISQDIRLPSSNVEVQVGDEHLVHRGVLVKVFRETGQFVLARFGWFPGGRVGFQNATGRFVGFEANGDDVILDSPYVRANPSRFIAQGYSALTVSQADKEIVGYMVRQYDPATTQYDEKLLGDAELAARLKPFFNSTGVSGDARPVLAVFCRPRSADAPTQQVVVASALADEATLAHKLKTTIVLADFYQLLGTGAYKRDDQLSLLPSPDANTIKIYIPTERAPWTGRIILNSGLPT